MKIFEKEFFSSILVLSNDRDFNFFSQFGTQLFPKYLKPLGEEESVYHSAWLLEKQGAIEEKGICLANKNLNQNPLLE